jgi:uncharacterized protein (DUF934 family)
MRKIIRDRQAVDDGWVYLAAGEPVPASGDVVVPLATLQADGAALLARSGRLGVRIEAGEGIADAVPHLAKLALVCVDFPTFHDGRGLSYARELRERHGYQGEIRAVGDVQRDQLFGMWRCGINAFDLKEGKSLEDALLAWNDFSTGYQADVHEPRPVYRR